ncbi:MAG: hypothetical protein P8185_17260 [Deltaproteobacteria bacterium]|jgi:hypothetical protein
MVISTNFNLIPYSDQHYPIGPYFPKNELVNRHSGQESITRHNRLGKPHSTIKTGAGHFDTPHNRYDAGQCLQYSDADQVGRLLDIYA